MIRQPANDGQRQLRELGLSTRAIGAQVGVSHETVRRWLAGEKCPTDRRPALQVAFGIDEAAWDRAPSRTGEPLTLASALAQTLRAAELRIEEPLPDSPSELDELIGRLDRALRQRDIAPSMLARLAAVRVQAFKAREATRTVREQAARSPECDQLIGEMVDALGANPLAQTALVRIYLAACGDEKRLAGWDAARDAWAERHADLVAAAEAANAALSQVLPPGARFDAH